MRMSTLLNEVKEIEEKLLSERVTSTAFRKKTARVNPMTQKDIERMVKDKKYKGNTSGLMKDVKKKFPDEYESDIVQDMMKKHAETNEAVSPAQQAAIAISKKERGEKPKDEKDEGNTFGMALKSARDKGEKTFVVSGKKYNVEDLDTKDEPKVKEIIKKLKGASQAHAGQAKDLEKAVSEMKLNSSQIGQLKKAFEPLRGKKISPSAGDKLMKIMDKVEKDRTTLIDLMKADIPFVSQVAAARLISKHNMKGAEINKLREAFGIDEIQYIDEAKFQVNYSKGGKLFSKIVNAKNEDDAEDKAIKQFKIEDDDIRSVVKESVELDEEPYVDTKREYLVLIDKDNKIVGEYEGNDALKDAKDGVRSASLPPMSIPKNEVPKMRIVRMNKSGRKDRGRQIGDKLGALTVGLKVKVGKMELGEAMYHHVLKNKVVASGSKSDMMKLVKKTGATVRKGPDTNYVLNSPGAKVGDIKEINEKFTKKDFKDNEDSNHHTENGVEIVNMFGTPAEKKLMAQIAKNHQKNRGISQKEQKLRDAMVKKYYSKLESVNEMSYKPGSFKDTRPQEKTAKALDDLIMKGGVDKNDYRKVRILYVQASDPKSRNRVKDFIYNLDTEPKEEIMNVIGRNDPETFLKMYPNAKKGEPLTRVSFAHRSMKSEEVELTEADGEDDGYYTIVVNGIRNLKKAEDELLDNTDFNIQAYIEDAGTGRVIVRQGGHKGNSVVLHGESKDMKIVQKWCKDQSQLAKATQRMIKPNMDYNDLYEKRADHLYVAALEVGEAKPNKAPVYTVKFTNTEQKEEVELNDIISQVCETISFTEKRKLTPDQRAKRDAVKDIKKDPELGNTTALRKAKIKRDKSDRKSHERPDSAQEKNVLQQLKVAINMRGDKDVEFEDGKQVKVPSKVAQKVLKLNDTMKPQEKGEFQRTIAKSYKDLLNAIKGK